MTMLSRFATLGGAPTDPYYSYVTLLLTGSNLLDSSPSPKTVTVYGSTSVDSAVKIYGTSSILFNGTTDYLSCTDNAGFNLNGNISFTIECWIRWTSVANEQNIVEQFSAPAGPGWTMYKFNPSSNGGIIDFYGGSTALGTGVTPTVNNWYFIAFCRDASTGNASYYVNGTRVSLASFSIPSVAATPLLVGKRQGASPALNGNLQDLRITKGVARYTGSTCPVPTAPFPTQGP